MARLILTLCLGLLLGGFLLSWSGSPASGQTSTLPPSNEVLTEQEVFRLREYMKKTTPSQFVSDSEATRRRLAMTKAARSKLPGLSKSLITKGGLAGVAAGVWIHNGISIYNATQCGETSCPPALILDAEFKQATDATAVAASGATFKGYDLQGNVIASGMVLEAKYSVASSNYCTQTMEIAAKYSPGATRAGDGGFRNLDPVSYSSGCASNQAFDSGKTVYEQFSFEQGDVGPLYQFFTRDQGGPDAGVRHFFGPKFKVRESVNWQNPVFEVGSVSPTGSAPAVNYDASPTDSRAFYNDIVNETCTPEAPPSEVCPDYFPQEWEEEFPPGTEDPYGDPDGDQLPNHSDPDDDGDDVPDEQDDQPLVPLPDSPMGDPDEDGDPNKTDPDDDGDGIPDGDDPEPRTPTDPSTLPQEHPYADPDEDGTPNRNDEDDDGDSVPDTEDPAPYDPTQPEPDPNADRDGDDVPDKIDPEPANPSQPSRYTRTDTDGDGSPDPYDPSPNDPGDPAGGPDGNPDGDGSPNRHDPYPNNPNRPASDPDGDLDQDGTPNRNDPDPYRPAQPTGGPSGDSDQDGTPNAQDPAPTDESKPATERGGSCPIAPPRAQIEGPDGAMSSIFPFNMFIMAVENIKVLGAPPKAPPLPILFPEAQAGVEEFSLSEFDPQASLARTIFSVAGSIYCGFFIYKLASQSKEGD